MYFIHPQWLTSLFLALMLALIPTQAHAYSSAEDFPTLEEFITQVSNGDAESLRGIYVPGLFASPVIAQPKDAPAFVSRKENTLTQFGLASQYGSIGLLAHNNLAGKNFSLLGEGRVFHLIYGDGRVETFIVTHLTRAQALEPENIYSEFIDLDTGALLTAPGLFHMVYDQPGKVILQTCIEAHGNLSWGRLFVIAEPYTEPELGSLLSLTSFD